MGSYGGAGFRSTEFLQSQRSDAQEFLRELIQTQMFDDFITKRLYGSGAADVIFFDTAVDKYLKRNISLAAGMKMLGLRGRNNKGGVGGGFGGRNNNSDEPLLQSARIHRKLKTIVPPEPSGADLPKPLVTEEERAENALGEQLITVKSSESTSRTSNTKGTPMTGRSSLASSEKRNAEASSTANGTATSVINVVPRSPAYHYDTFPSKLNPELFGEPRPLPPAVLAEFNRQKENAAQFRRRKDGNNHKGMDMKSNQADRSTCPEVTSFTVFFTAFTTVVGKELINLSSDDPLLGGKKRDIMSSVRPSSGVSIDDSDEYTTSTELSGDDSDISESSPSSKTQSSAATTFTTRKRFRDSLNKLQIEELKATATAELELALEILEIMHERKLKADPVTFKSLIDACGRCGDTEGATKLLARMHEDGIVADGVVYSCLVSAFSVDNAWSNVSNKNKANLPEWANGASVEVDWNKLQKRSWRLPLGGRTSNTYNDGNSRSDDDSASQSRSFMDGVKSIISRKKNSQWSVKAQTSDATNSWDDPYCNEPPIEERYVTDSVLRQITFGENLLEILYPDISIDTDNEYCPRCNFLLSDDHVVDGWEASDHSYTTKCPQCPQKIVPHFCVQSTGQTFVGSKGPGSPLFCERLSPWVLQKELGLKISDTEGIEDILDPSWREKETKNAVLWWNLILTFMRYRLPFTFLLQGSFEQKLIAPMPEDDTSKF